MRIAIVLGLAASLGGLTAATWAAPLRVATDDGLALLVMPDATVEGVALDGRQLPAGVPGGFLVADFGNPPEPPNLVSNPGLEDGSAGWALGPGQFVDEGNAHRGSRSARLYVPGPVPGSTSLGRTAPVTPGGRYRVGLWLRRENCGTCGVYVSELGPDGSSTGEAPQLGLSVPSGDRVWRHVTREVQVGPKTTQLLLRGDIYRSTGTVWLDDFSITPISAPKPEALVGRATRAGRGAVISGEAAQCALEATVQPGAESIAVSGTVRDLAGKDRAVAVTFRAPVDAAGWTWFDDLEERRTVEASASYRNTYACITGVGECSVYPWSALSGPAGGLSLGLPLSQGPRVFVTEYDAADKALQITFYLALTGESGAPKGTAPFAFVLYRHDPAWGMRSAVQRYYALYPGSFARRTPNETYLNYADFEVLDPATHDLLVSGSRVPDASDFGEGFNHIWHLHGCYWFQMAPTADSSPLSDAKVFELLGGLVEEEKTTPDGYCPTAEAMKKLVFGRDGRISYIGDTQYWRAHEGYNQLDRPGWGLNFRVNEDPDISDTLMRSSRAAVERYAQGKPEPWTGSLSADAIEGYFANQNGPDYRREHFAASSFPLSFDKDTLAPCIVNTIWDFHEQAWRPLSEEYQVATYGNANGYEQAFTLPYCDIPMIENDWDPTHPGRFERYVRTMAYHKIWRFWRVLSRGGAYSEGDPASVQRHFERGLAYAIYPAVYPFPGVPGGIEPYRAEFRRYVPAIESLSSAGWEPIPYARVAEGTAVVERFGSFDEGSLQFTLRNYAAEPVTVAVSLDLTGLGISADLGRALIAWELLEGPRAWQRIRPGAWRVEVPADGTRAFWVGTREGLARYALRRASADLRRVGRTFGADLSEEAKAEAGRLAAECDAAALAGTMAELSDVGLRASADAGGLVRGVTSGGPVDLAKAGFRIQTDLSGIGIAATGLRVSVPRTVTGVRGEVTPVSVRLANDGELALEGLRFEVLSPWPAGAGGSAFTCPVVAIGPRGRVEATVRLAAPAAADRELLPFVLRVSGNVSGQPFVVPVPVDLVLRPAVAMAAAAARVAVGSEQLLAVSLTNEMAQGVQCVVRFEPPAGIEVVGGEGAFSLSAGQTQEVELTVRAAAAAALGEHVVTYTVADAGGTVIASGSIGVSVVSPPRTASVRRLGGAVQVDGRLDDAAWAGEPAIPALGLMSDGAAPAQGTAVWAAWDEAALYLAVRCLEANMPALRAELTARGAPLYQDDDLEVFIAAPGAPTPLQFAVNPLGTRSDNFGNDAAWEAAAQRGEREWTVEMRVPFAVLGMAASPSAGTALAVQIGRQQKPAAEVSSWTPARSFGDAGSFGELALEP